MQSGGGVALWRLAFWLSWAEAMRHGLPRLVLVHARMRGGGNPAHAANPVHNHCACTVRPVRNLSPVLPARQLDVWFAAGPDHQRQQ